ncbi:MAG: hypothetical protein HYY34_03150 [Chloroflexi bacterium]|nr:hypothetical protein [Chloroflexota bacterium]
MLTIVGPREFWHAADLSAKFSSIDPRVPGLDPEGLEINLRRSEFVRPAAVLWCAVYGSLARNQRVPVRLLAPENLGVSIHLKSVGLFHALQECGVDVDDRGVRDRVDSKIVLPVTKFGTEAEVEELANVALERVIERELGASNLRPIVAEVFAELAMNAVQHAESPIPAFGLIQFYGFGTTARFVCVVRVSEAEFRTTGLLSSWPHVSS